LVIAEATAVAPEGRISPGDAGIYHDEHVAAYAPIADFIRRQGAVPGIQLAHAGRKASASRPWEGDSHLGVSAGGWETIAPSAVAFGGNLPKVPKEMTLADINRVQADFVAAAQRSLAAGFQWLELHFAHGYLAHEFYSPLSNFRTDHYGVSFENRIRFLRETLQAVRGVWPERFPLTARLSVTDWTADGVTLEESIELTRLLKSDGLDLLDVSHGFVVPDISAIPWGPGFMVPATARIKREAGIPVACGWMITEPNQAEAIIGEDAADLVMLAREFLRDPYWPYHAARSLGVTNPGGVLPVQYTRAVG
jgi:2,4-dienoyl-CoA reductase-like NADH-dependent reductase (Old Yellow Enzyme family)